MGASDHKFAGGVDQQLHIVGDEGGFLGAQTGLDAGQKHLAHILGNLLLHGGVGLLLSEGAGG